jgi:hypothetical protein
MERVSKADGQGEAEQPRIRIEEKVELSTGSTSRALHRGESQQ